MSEDSSFDHWLKEYLLKLNPETDVDVFGEYISSLLNDDEEDVLDSLKEMLSQIVDDEDTTHACEEILRQYSKLSTQKPGDQSAKGSETLSPEEQLRLCVEEDKQKVVDHPLPSRSKSSGDGYRYQEREEEDDEDFDGAGISYNDNRSAIEGVDKQRRAEMKLESKLKKEKDKLDREKQLEKAKARAESEKHRTQKRERRGR